MYHPGISDPGEVFGLLTYQIKPFRFSAVLITGGGWDAWQSAEIYHPGRDSACILPDLPVQRYGNHLAWDLVTESLTEERYTHISWTPADGPLTYLLMEHPIRS